VKIAEKPFYTRIALLGTGVFLFLALIIFVAILILSPSDIVFPIVLAVPALVIAALVYFVHPWGLIAAILGGLVALLFTSEGIDLSITSPDAFFDFIFPVFGILTAVLLLGGGIGGLVQHFRKRTSQEGPAIVSNSVKAALGLVAVLVIISAALTAASLGDVSASEKEGAVVLTAKDEEFLETALTASPAGKILLKNRDPLLHTFTIDALDIDEKMGPGREKVFELESVPAGQYGFRCRVPGHEDMSGILTVR
jgi:plastocyanin